MDEEEVRAVEARVSAWAERANDRGPQEWNPLEVADATIVVGHQGTEGTSDPRLVGLVLSPGEEFVIGTIPDSPASELGMEQAAKLVGLPVDRTAVERIRSMIDAALWMQRGPEPRSVDGRYRMVGVAYMIAANRVAEDTWGQHPESAPNRSILAEFDRRMEAFDREYSAITLERTGRLPVPTQPSPGGGAAWRGQPDIKGNR